MKKILVIHYSQTGQLTSILQSITAPLLADYQVDFANVYLEQDFPFPWNNERFFNVMPECFLRIASPIKDMDIDTDEDYDLIILGFQPWFLTQSIPTNSFLQSKYAQVLKGKPVITVIGCRNMWLHALETVKGDLYRLKAQHVGNIVFEDKHDNLTALYTIIRWLFGGKKEASGRWPEAGVVQKDVVAAKRFALPVSKALESQEWELLHDTLLSLGAVHLVPSLIVLEKRGVSQYPKWAKKAIERGKISMEARAKIIKQFRNLLFIAIFVLSPVSGITAKMAAYFRKKKFEKEVTYFKSIQYIPNKF